MSRGEGEGGEDKREQGRKEGKGKLKSKVKLGVEERTPTTETADVRESHFH